MFAERRLRGEALVTLSVALALGHMLILLNASAYAPMEIQVASSLGKVTSYATWSQTDYMIGMALGLPLAGFFGKRFGPRHPLMCAYLLFAVAATACALSPTIYCLVVARFCLGLAGGVTLPLSQALFLAEYPERRKALALTLWSFCTLGPAGLGPMLGGWLADEPGWRWMFYADIPLALFCAGTLWALLYGRRAVIGERAFDLPGAALLFLTVISLQALLNMGTDWDWFDAPLIAALAAVGGGAAVMFCLWEWREPEPFVALRCFADRNFAVGAGCLIAGFFCIQGLLTFFVVQLQSSMGYTAFLAGLYYLPMFVFAKPLANASHHLAQAFDARKLATVGLLGFTVAYWWIAGFDRKAAFQDTWWPKLLEGAALGAFFVPLTVIAIARIPRALQPRAVELANTLRLWAGAMGIPAQTAIWYHHQWLHRARIGEGLGPFDPNTAELLGGIVGQGYGEQAAQAKISQWITQQASIQAIDDCFRIAGAIFLVLAGLVWLAHPTHLPSAPRPAEEQREVALEEAAEDL
jgi:DHA2 family multidrug resistance protein